jgi:hypothetical protein
MTLDRKATVDDNCDDGLCRDQSGVDAAREGKKLVVLTAVSFAVAAGGLGFGVFFLASQDQGAARSRPVGPTIAVATWTASF